ncbi:MAG: YkgJ family cysteine cluster protein [Candidatus Desulfofervidaceae bacterium]|nr:YkgJ family cysteine cluster protein [Candidatus Desulfofervidaceae bacterium]MDL1971304.1 YkgJ family cysteine cluster protein [Candidatus Desulfofervidaceae bacterium]
MSIPAKLKVLKAIYEFYDNYTGESSFACTIGCTACCTQQVLITSLEGSFIISYLKEKQQLSLLNNVITELQKPHFRPLITTNELAYYCLQQKEPPEETPYASERPCPFLNKGRCLIYEVRPFACRSFFSQIRCDITGEARIPPLLLTINVIFNQLIEHIDVPGIYGNMIDVLSFLQEESNLGKYYLQQPLTASGLLANRPIPGFLYPPEHQQEVERIFKRLALIKIGDIDMKMVLARILRFGEN